MGSVPFRLEDTADLVVSPEFATTLLGEIKMQIAKRPVYPIMIGEHEGGHWQVERVHTLRRAGGYDDIVATFRRVLP